VLKGAGEAGASTAVRRPGGHVAAGELDRPGGREVESGEDVHERRLPGAVRADQADDFVVRQLEGDVAQRVDALEGP
jgi:hypothetical protein